MILLIKSSKNTQSHNIVWDIAMCGKMIKNRKDKLKIEKVWLKKFYNGQAACLSFTDPSLIPSIPDTIPFPKS